MKKKKSVPVPENSMKSALEDLNVRVSTEPSKKFNLRDAIWNYPITLCQLYKKSIPFSYIIIFSLVAFLLILFLNSIPLINWGKGSSNKDTFTEGLVGSVNSLNPLFVTNNFSDRTIQNLVFQKFVNIDKEGNPQPAVAKSWSSSENGKVVDFELNTDLKWSDGTDLTMDDVIFTFESAMSLAEDTDFDSVGEAIVGVEMERVSDTSLRFKLKENNPVFFKAISIFIVPKSKLGEVEIGRMVFDQFSKYPMGSGKFAVVKHDDYEVILKDNAHDIYEPAIKNIAFKIYPSIEAEQMSFRVGNLDAVGGWDKKLFEYTEEYQNYKSNSLIVRDREKLIFLNVRKDSLKDVNMRKALSFLLDKEEVLKELDAGGEILNGPLPSTSWAYSDDIEKYPYSREKAAELLKNLGYTFNEESGYYETDNKEILNFTLTYLDNDTNNRIVDLLVGFYKDEGVFIKSEKVDYKQITEEIIATRNFEMLLYEVETTIDPDQYNLWHSLKVNFPDLNLSGYSYERIDILLEEGRQTVNRDTRKQKYLLFQRYLTAGAPALFLYNPSFEYITKSNLVGVNLELVNNSYERFHNIEEWYWE